MKYVATKKGYYGDRVIQPGEVFEADEFESKWAVKKGSEKPVKEKPEDQLIEEAKEAVQGKKKKKKATKKAD